MKGILRTSVFLYLLYLFFVGGHSLRANPELSFYHYYTKNGLPHNYIYSICQDKQGFLWIGTRNGLARFDGYKFISYDPESHDHGVLPAYVTDIWEDQEGKLWLSTPVSSLFFYIPQKDSFYYLKDKFTKVYPDHKGQVWILFGSSLYSVKQNTFLQKTSKYESPKPGTFKRIFREKKDDLWVYDTFDEKELSMLPASAIMRYRIPVPDKKNIYVNQFYRDTSGTFWISTFSSGLIHFIPDSSEILYTPTSSLSHRLPDNHVYGVFERTRNELWIGTMKGLSILNRKTNRITTLQSYAGDKESISDNVVTTFYHDNSGTIWVGTRFGLNRLLRKKFRHFYHENGKNSLINNNVHAFYEDNNHDIWIATSNGLDQFNRKTERFRHYPVNETRSGWLDAAPITLKGDDLGNLWIGTWRGGLFYFEKNKNIFHKFSHNPDIPGSIINNNIFNIYIDSQKRLWVGTWAEEGQEGGLDRYDPERRVFIHYKPGKQNGLSSNRVGCILEDQLSRLWTGTMNGLDMLTDPEKGIFIVFRNDPDDSLSLSNNKISCLFEDSKHALWIGTSHGLNKLLSSGKDFLRITTANGLPSNSIKAIQEDREGNLWISTNKGLSEIIRDSVTEEILNIKKFDVEDGLQDEEFLERSVLKCSDGSLLFGGTNGFNLFDPEKIIDNPIPPRCVITQFRVLQHIAHPDKEIMGKIILTQPVSLTKEITLPHKFNVFSIEFAGLHYEYPEKNKYAYKLTGFDKNWQYTDASKRIATYTNLDGGKYIFEVKAANSDGIWSHQPAKLIINITPPFTSTLFFKVILFLSIVLIVFLYFEARLLITRKQKKLLRLQVAVRTKEIQRQKDEILQQKEQIEHQAYEIRRMNELLKKHNIKLAEQIKDLSEARVMQKLLDYDEFKKFFPDQDACYKLLAELKWGNGFVCKRCGSTKYSIDEPFIRRCKVCNYKESVTAGTIFHHLRFPIEKAMYILIIASTGRKINISQLSKTLSLRMKTCWNFYNKVKKQLSARSKKSKWKKGNWIDLLLLDQNHGRDKEK